MSESLSALGSIPGMECLRSITPLAHHSLPKRDSDCASGQTASAICTRDFTLMVGYIP